MTSELLIARRASIYSDQQAMEQALDLAREAALNHEVPVGAVVLYRGQMVGWGRNQPINAHDPSAHAEMLAIRMAAQHLQNYRLPDCELFVSLEPCVMCYGAIIHSRIKRVVFAASDPKTGACGSVLALQQEKRLNHHAVFESGLLAEESAKLLTAFFTQRRKNKLALAPQQHSIPKT